MNKTGGPGPSLPAIEDTTRRDFLVGGAAVLLLGGCGGSGDGDGENPSVQTRTVRHALGTTEVPRQPRRVIALDPSSGINLKTLGVEVIGAVKPNIASPAAVRSLLPEAELVGTESAPNLEKIATLRPDMIVMPSYEGEAANYDQLSEIAPTVAYRFLNPQWEKMLRQQASFVGRVDEAERLISRHQKRLQSLRGRVEAAGRPTINYLRFYAERLGVCVGYLETRLMSEAGFRFPEGYGHNTESPRCTSESLEQLPRLDADILLVGVDPGAEDLARRYRESPLWRRLGAIREGRVLEVNTGVWLSFDYPGIQMMLDDLERALGLLG
ncbi:MAG: iron-siderophore ABC transporter substrate-binding protein [Rubrobacter sp.]|nr:iron-siderophore ABC transporter substrate-binding protein [Rubrobacter sp.]